MSDAESLDVATREALAGLLVTVADDEFVIGFWDSEWTGIAPMLEEDVATSSIAQDEIGHARGDWAHSVARRFLYESADATRLTALAAGTWAPLTDLATKMRREEVYHR